MLKRQIVIDTTPTGYIAKWYTPRSPNPRHTVIAPDIQALADGIIWTEDEDAEQRKIRRQKRKI